MSTLNQTRVTQIANAILFTDLSQTDFDYWTDQLDREIYTPTSLALLATQTESFQNENLPLATMYYTAFGTFATIQEVMIWKNVLQNGASVTEIGTAFVTSYEFNTANPTATLSDAARLDALIASSGVTLSQETKDFGLAGLAKKSFSWGDVLLYLANQSNDDLLVGLALLETAASGAIPSESRITSLGQDLPEAMSTIFADNPIELSRSYTGTTQNDNYAALSVDTSIRAMQGDDTLYAGSAIDTFIFESTPSANGIDTIYDFEIGEAKDVFDFSRFLNLPSTSSISTVLQTSTTPASWQNGSILVASGNALTTPDAIAALFGAAKPYAAPTTALKAVLITSDIIGDAAIWYIINQTDTANITADEIYQVATIKELNNLSLVGLHETNFVAESA